MDRLVALLICFVLVSCGESPRTPSQQTGTSRELSQYSCGSDTFSREDIAAQRQPSDDVLAALHELRQTIDGAILPEESWIEVATTGTRVTILAPLRRAAASATFEQSDGTWRARGWGECLPRLKIDDKSVLRWAFTEAAYPPAPEATELDIRVIEVNCSSGREIKGLIEPTVSYSDEVIKVVLTAPGPVGGDCIGTAPTPYTLVLDEPVGDRAVVDPSVYPVVEPSPGTRLP